MCLCRKTKMTQKKEKIRVKEKEIIRPTLATCNRGENYFQFWNLLLSDQHAKERARRATRFPCSFFGSLFFPLLSFVFLFFIWCDSIPFVILAPCPLVDHRALAHLPLLHLIEALSHWIMKVSMEGCV